MTPTALQGFQPEVKEWFENSVGQPTEIQYLAWPLILSGEHLVLTAPTGSGKTLAAFLCAIDSLLKDTLLLGKTRILYISPLKALNNDIQRNLLTPLTQLKDVYAKHDKTIPAIKVMTRSGDTSQGDRRRMLRHPPEILITTPESLNLLLSTQSGRILLGDLHTVILDEVHAVINGKRGAHLMSAIERLPRLCGELQRIALSATVNPIELVADFIGGYRLSDSNSKPGSNSHQAHYEKRRVKRVIASNDKRYSLKVINAIKPSTKDQSHAEGAEKEDFWHPLVEKFSDIIAGNHSTLLFTNSRRLCEKLTMKINTASGDRVAYSHHGSLSREIRAEVEKKLKAGELKAIVATSSLELGIDVGALDEVILVQSPPSISASIQRLGRAGHSVGQISHGRLFPTHPEDFVQAAALAKAVQEQDIEAINPIRCPLDILAQIIISMCANQTWDIDELYNQLRCSYTFHELSRHHYELILNMLAGRYADTRIRELKPRVSWDQLDNSIVATKGAVLALYLSGGTIPNRGYYQLRDVNSNGLIGELDEEFVWEASIGQIFTLGTQYWKVERITHNDVFVSPGVPKNSVPPFWRAESGQRDFHFSCAIGELLEWAEQLLQSSSKQDEQTLLEALQEQYYLDKAAADTLLAYLRQQRQHTNVPLPHRHHIVLEHINSGPGGHAGYQLVLHTGWGGAINRPFALALEAAWESSMGAGAKLYADDNCVVIQLPQNSPATEILSLVTEANLENLLKQRLEGSGFFAARFRECAGRALLLTKTKFNQRLPLWMSRLQAQKLHAAVDKFEDFPILLESWRCCLQDEFDLPHCRQVLAELASGQISWSETFSSSPSPFAYAVSWGQISQYMYMEDRNPDNASTNLREDLLRDVVFSPALRPTIANDIKQQFEDKRQRLYPGYCPTSARELLDWLKERLLLPLQEWKKLLIIIADETRNETTQIVSELASRACILSVQTDVGVSQMIIAAELVPKTLLALYNVSSIKELPKGLTLTPLLAQYTLPIINSSPLEEDSQLLADKLLFQWLSFYGPQKPTEISQTLGLSLTKLSNLVDDLLEHQSVISGVLLEGKQQQICDADNFETLLRLQRANAIPVFMALPSQFLALFIAEQQGLIKNTSAIDAVYDCIETLRGIYLPAAQWEQNIFPARMAHYDPAWLDSLMQENTFYWQGNDKKSLCFLFDDEQDLWTDKTESIITEQTNIVETEPDEKLLEKILLSLLQESNTGLDFFQLLELFCPPRCQTISSSKLVELLWRLVWSKKISNDTYSPIRKGILHKFKLAPFNQSGSARNTRLGRPIRPSRRRYAQQQESLPYTGRWFCIRTNSVSENSEQDLIEHEENIKERARILLARYGMVCRVLISREDSPFTWRKIFRALRLMELSGEVLAGQFFADIPGPQFITHQAFRRLQKPLPERSIFWLNATDPASLCGLAIDKLKSTLPKRLATTQLVYCGTELIIISERSGKSLQILIEPDDVRLSECFTLFSSRLQRQFSPDKRIIIERINDLSANRSPYLDTLRLVFDVLVDHKQTILQRRYTA